MDELDDLPLVDPVGKIDVHRLDQFNDRLHSNQSFSLDKIVVLFGSVDLPGLRFLFLLEEILPSHAINPWCHLDLLRVERESVGVMLGSHHLADLGL